jgi:hypothetical protein
MQVGNFWSGDLRKSVIATIAHEGLH